MFFTTVHIIRAFILSRILLIAITILGSKQLPSRNKNRAFECGFDPKDSARLPFSIRFFLLVVVFLIFDIEVALLFPVILGIKIYIFKRTLLAGFIFLIILLIGLVHEWNQGSLRWIN